MITKYFILNTPLNLDIIFRSPSFLRIRCTECVLVKVMIWLIHQRHFISWEILNLNIVSFNGFTNEMISYIHMFSSCMEYRIFS